MFCHNWRMDGFYKFIFIVIHLGYQISVSEAFTEPCYASLKTIQTVPKCPANMSSFEAAARIKNCSSLAANARDCKSFEFHCVLGEDLKSAVELCAPSINIIDNVCTTFSTYYKSIIRVHELNCSECPWSYNSTNAFQYQQCYSNNNQHLTTELATSTPENSGTTLTIQSLEQSVKQKVGVSDCKVIFVVVAVFGFLISVLTYMYVYKCRRQSECGSLTGKQVKEDECCSLNNQGAAKIN